MVDAVLAMLASTPREKNRFKQMTIQQSGDAVIAGPICAPEKNGSVSDSKSRFNAFDYQQGAALKNLSRPNVVDANGFLCFQDAREAPKGETETPKTAESQKPAAAAKPAELPKPRVTMPDALKNLEPSSTKIDSDGTIVRTFDNGYVHKMHKNGSEELLKDGLTMRQMQCSDLSKLTKQWYQDEISYEYQSGKSGEKPTVSKLTVKTLLNDKETEQTYKVGEEASNPGRDGKKSKVTEITAIPGKEGGFEIIFANGSSKAAYLDGRSTEDDGKGWKHSEEFLRSEQNAPDGKSKLPAGTWLKHALPRDLPASATEAYLPEGSDPRSSCTYLKDSKGVQQVSESFKKERDFTVKVNGKDHTEKGIISWDRQKDGSLLLYRPDPKEEGQMVPSVYLRADKTGKFIRVEKPPKDLP